MAPLLPSSAMLALLTMLARPVAAGVLTCHNELGRAAQRWR